jgi:hypothetical protein
VFTDSALEELYIFGLAGDVFNNFGETIKKIDD